MLKEVVYKRKRVLDGKIQVHKVAYLIKGKNCYFTNLNKDQSFTIMYAEAVLLTICQREEIPFSELRFFDIETHIGTRYYPGHYEVKELILHRSDPPEREREKFKLLLSAKAYNFQIDEDAFVPKVERWLDALLPDDIKEHFQHLIGEKLETKYHKICSKSEGLYCVRDENYKFFFVDHHGVQISGNRFVDVAPFSNGIAWVNKGNDKWVKMDRQGRIISPWINGSELRYVSIFP